MSAEDAVIRAHSLAEEAFIAGSSPGGQNANKVATGVQLRVNIYALALPSPVFHRLKTLAGSRLTQEGDILIVAKTHRTQDANRAEARDRLATLLEDAHKQPKKRARTRLNRIGKVKRLKHKKARGEVKANRAPIRP